MFSSLQVQGYKSISDSGRIPLGPITLVVGRNNTGKSALIRAPYLIQDTSIWQNEDIRHGESTMTVELEFDELPMQLRAQFKEPLGSGVIRLRNNAGNKITTISFDAAGRDDKAAAPLVHMFSKEPHNLFVPVLAGRRPAYYREQISRDNALNVTARDDFIVSRVLPLVSSNIKEAKKFRQLCRDILGTEFNVFAGENSMQQLGTQIDLRQAISLEAMGAGLSGALGLILGLSTAEGKFFIIEEPEDDLHPKALKDLLDAIIESSKVNQFLISTHNSTVLTRLGAVAETRIVHVESNGEIPPTSSYHLLTDQSERLDVLQDLGYSLADMDLGEGWLIFEESSAERLIRQYLARWFAPNLLKLRTVAANGNSRVRPLFDNFREMFLYAHLERAYRNRAWVIVDGDELGIAIIERLRRDFSSWPQEHFIYWQEKEFERYYPSVFGERIEAALSEKDRQKKKKAKEELINDVIAWIEEDEDRAREAFRDSAADVISVLEKINGQLAA
jgi:predicted ATP-dependent endonuclease of OLD family